MGQYSDAINRTRIGMDPEQIHRAKNAKKKQRGETRRLYNRFLESQRASVNPKDQLANLDFRLGVNAGSTKERKKLLARI